MGELVGHVAELALVQVTVQPGDDFETVVRSLKLTPSFGPLWYTGLDLGTPAADVSETRYANDNGVYDGTRYGGSRAVSITLTINDGWFPAVGAETWDQRWNASSFWDKELGRWTAPGFRSWLWLRFVGDPNPYRIDLSGRGKSSPITTTDRTVRQVQLNFSSPSGLLREFSPDLELSRTTKDGRLRASIPYGDETTTGVTPPLHFPITIPRGASGGAVVEYDGTVPAGFLCRIHAGAGAVIDPAVTLEDALGIVSTLTFRGLTIQAGHYVEIDSEAKRVTLDGDLSQPAERYVHGPLRWQRLQPGPNTLSWSTVPDTDGGSATTPAAGSYAEILFYPTSV